MSTPTPPTELTASPSPSRPGVFSTLAPHVCPLVLAALAREGADFRLPRQESFPAVVLRTDISGFTGLTETLHARGAAGVEELSRVLDAYFARLIGLVSSRGGLVFKVAGDALTAVWPIEGDDPAATVRRVVECAGAIRQALGGFANGAGEHLAMRIGVAFGEAQHAVLGGAGERWLSSLCGPVVEQANRAVSLALAGQVMAAERVARLVGDPQAAGTEGFLQIVFDPAPLPPDEEPAPLELPELSGAALFPHVSTAIRDRLVAGQVGWLGEFRRVSILFIQVPADAPVRQETVAALQEIVGRFEGTVDDLDDERPGVTLIAAFGLPPLAHEDNASRAVQAALSIQREFAGRGLPCAIGVASGEVFCGAIGSRQRRTYRMIGDAMNRCARLMDRAGDDILCDEATFAAAHRGVMFEELPSVALRGIRQPVAVFRPLGDQTRRPLEVDGLVGRARERLAMELRLVALQRGGAAGPVLIEGEPGLGKSTLLSALLPRAGAAGALTLFGGAESVDRTRSYGAWPGIFQTLFGLRAGPAEDRARRAAAVLAEIPSHLELAALTPIFNPVLGLDLPDNDATELISAQSRAEIIADTLVRLLHRAAERGPVVLALDDCQWLNSASWELVANVRARVPEVFCVLATRPLGAEAPEAWTEARKAPGASFFQLGPLPAPHLGALVCRRLGVESIPAALSRFIADRTDGHPLFAEALVDALRDAGHVVVENGVCRLPPTAGSLEDLRFPGTVQGVIRARFDRLSPQEQLTMKVASVIGRTFSLRALMAIHPVEADREQLPQILQRLADARLIERDATHPEVPCSFAHAIIEETAYETMLFAQRRELHARFARWLEAEGRTEAGLDLPALAHHWAMAEEDQKAIDYAERAGEQAFRRFGNREAAQFFEQALRRSPGPDTVAERHRHAWWYLQLGEAHFHLGVLDTSQRHLHRAIELFGYHAPPKHLALPNGLPAAIFRQTWNRLRGKGASDGDARDREPLTGAIRAFNMLGEMSFFRNDLHRAAYCCIHGLNLAERLQAPAKLAEMYAATMIVAAALPGRALSGTYYRLANATLERVDDPVTAAYVRYLFGIYFTGLGEWQVADELLDEAHAAFLHFGDSRRLDECLCTLIYSRFHRGEFVDAGRLVTEMVESSDRRRDAQTSGWSRSMKAQHALPTAGAEASLAIFGGDPSVAIDMLTKITYCAVIALAAVRLGRRAEALANCREALRLILSVPPVSAHMVPSANHIAEAIHELWHGSVDAVERRELKSLAAGACRSLRDYARAFPIAGPQALLWAGVNRFLRGDRAGGAKRLAQAGQLAEQRQMPHEAAWAHFQRARFSQEAAERAAECARAVELLTRCGTEADVELVKLSISGR